MELTAALAVLLVVGLIAGTGEDRRQSTPQPRWATSDSAAVTTLIGDLAAVERDSAAVTGHAAGNWVAGLHADAARLAADLASARSLRAAATASLSAQWSAALAQVGPVVQAAERVVGDAGGAQAGLQADIQSLDAASTAAGDSLLRLTARLGT